MGCLLASGIPMTSSQYLPLDPKGCRILADALGDTPETVISVHSLRRALCKAYVAGDPSRFDGAIIQWDFLSSEPQGFGSDPEILWDLLKSVEGWDCICVASKCANALGQIIEKKIGVRVRYYGDVYYTLSKPVLNFQNKAVRQLTLKDLKLLESAPVEVQGCGFGSPRGLLSDGIVACAVVSEKIVAIAHTSARTERYADIGVFTLEGWRGRGFATDAASIVAKGVQESGQIPVWSTGEDNIASLRVAQKLGFTEVSRSTFVILDKSN
jgi:hypothetical protein